MGYRLFLPILLLVVAAVSLAGIACAEDGGAPPATIGLVPTHIPVEPAKPLTAAELAAVEQFETAMLEIESDRDAFYDEFDSWRAGLVECHPSSAREALRDFAASFAAVSDSARNLPRTSVTSELADNVIAATDAEDAALRGLRDRWQPGNVALLEAVEQGRVDAAAAHNTVADMSRTRQEELADGPTAAEI